MKKVGIISLYHNSYNYGGVLQAFALNYTINELGYEAYQIDYAPSRKKNNLNMIAIYIKSHSICSFLKKTVISLYKNTYSKILGIKDTKGIVARKKVFESFKSENIMISRQCCKDNIDEVGNNYDVLICGSDQIWKPSVVDDAYMLAFSKKDKKTFSYAASLSVDSLNNDEKERYRIWLSNLDAISVREKQAISILQPLTDTQIKLVCDPTLLLSREKWIHVIGNNNENVITEPYLFCYFLGDDPSFRKAAKIYAKKRGLKIVTFPNLQQKASPFDRKFGDYRIYTATPFDFVRFIRDAKIVFTDSFHATAFSLNLNVPFIVFERAAITSMNSRIESLLSITGCHKRFVKEYTMDALSNVPDIDWNIVNGRLSDIRENSKEFILTNLY